MGNTINHTHRVEVEVLVVGAGAGGLSAAISARLEGLDVLVVEKSDRIGGTTARSAGMIWIPGNSLARREGIVDSPEAARKYLAAEAGDLYDYDRVSAYIEQAPKMIDEFASRTSSMRFVPSDFVADHHLHLPGAVETGRTVTVPPFDGRLLGRDFQYLAEPLRTLTFLGMMIQPGDELNHFFNTFRSWASFRYVVSRLAEQARDAITHGRSTRLANGNALAARLTKSAMDLQIPIWRSAPAQQLVRRDNRIVGANIVCADGAPVEIQATLGVILATGGYPHDPKRRENLSPIYPEGAGANALAAEQNVGDGLNLAESVGAKVEDRLFNTISWVPVSKVPSRKGERLLFPHGFDRNKPGFIAVAPNGRRFVNEATVGNDFVRAMISECKGGRVEGFLVADHTAVKKYGIGVVRPAPIPMWLHLKTGYLVRGSTLRDLADKTGIDPDALEATVKHYNASAKYGEDPEFGKGTNEPERRVGDPGHLPNPNVGPLVTPPFYAVRILPGDYSTLAGLRTDRHARVLDADGNAIHGLYAAGNDNSTMAGGNTPSGGFTLGQAMTFGYVAGKHSASTK